MIFKLPLLSFLKKKKNGCPRVLQHKVLSVSAITLAIALLVVLPSSLVKCTIFKWLAQGWGKRRGQQQR